MSGSVQAKRLLRRVYRSGRLAKLGPQELRLFLFVLSRTAAAARRRRWRLKALRHALRLSARALNRAAEALERQGWLRIVRNPRTWLIEVRATRGKR